MHASHVLLSPVFFFLEFLEKGWQLAMSQTLRGHDWCMLMGFVGLGFDIVDNLDPPQVDGVVTVTD